MLTPVFRRMAGFAPQQTLNEVATARQAFRSPLKLAVRGCAFARPDKWPPSHGETNRGCHDNAESYQDGQNNVAKFFHLEIGPRVDLHYRTAALTVTNPRQRMQVVQGRRLRRSVGKWIS